MKRASKEVESSFIARGIIPPGASLIQASGYEGPDQISLDDEYQPSPERAARFARALHDLETLEQQAVIDSLDVGF